MVLRDGSDGLREELDHGGHGEPHQPDQNKHIVTLENPIEFLHRDINCSVTQREIGVDTDDFRAGLRAAMRQDPTSS